MSSLPAYEEIEHPADLALVVRGASVEQLFVHAAEGMFNLMQYERVGETAPVSERIRLAALDVDMLLVDWLSELLYRSEVGQALYTFFDITVNREASLDAQALGERGHAPRRSVKAVTYSDLAIEHTTSGYQATITFDV
jgi:SHS2 domain-containing protein